MSERIEPFPIAVPQAAIDDLHKRLARTRFPERETVDDWEQGVPLAHMQRLRDHWRNHYDWRVCEARMNALGSFRTVIDGLAIHFLHVRSPHPGARPLILTHGWPGSIVEFLKVAPALADPERHGGAAADAFHVVIPAIPGYGFGDKPAAHGWDIARVARAWSVLMQRLGYTDYIAQGGDWGAGISLQMGTQRVPGLAAVHLNLPLGFPTETERANLTAEETASLAGIDYHSRYGRAYSEIQRTRPQTLGYNLADSPIGQAAWIYEKFRFWSDCDGDPTNSFTLDELLDNISLYWLTDSGASAARMYHESQTNFMDIPVELPVGASAFPKEIFRSTRKWTERLYPDFRYWNETARGGHFAAFEVPDLFVDEVRAFVRTLGAGATAS